MKKFLLLMLSMSIIPIMAACGDDSDDEPDEQADQEEQGEQPDMDVSISDDEKVPDDDVVTTVNDTEIKGEEYNNVYAQTKSTMQMGGEDVDDQDEMKDQTLDILVQQELIKQDAEDKDITVSDDDVDEEFDEMKEDEDQFEGMLDQLNMDEEGLRDQLAFEMTVDKYMEEEFPDAEVSDEDAEEYYDQLKEQSEDVPEFDDIKDNIKDQLEEEKQGEKLQEKAEDLEEKADVENMI